MSDEQSKLAILDAKFTLAQIKRAWECENITKKFKNSQLYLIFWFKKIKAEKKRFSEIKRKQYREMKNRGKPGNPNHYNSTI